MTQLLLQKLTIPDCEATVERSYYDWGRGWPEDSPEPDWHRTDANLRMTIARRGYMLYDGWPPVYGNDIGALECYVSVGINSRVILNDAVRFLVRAREATPLLAQIPDRARLEDATKEQIDVAAELIDLFAAVPNLGRSKVTKVLYKKRPAFIPVVDSVVDDFMWKNLPHLISSSSGTREILLAYQHMLRTRKPALGKIQANLAAKGFDVSIARILSHVIWSEWYPRMRSDMSGPTFKEVWGTADMATIRQSAQRQWEAQSREVTDWDFGGVVEEV